MLSREHMQINMTRGINFKMLVNITSKSLNAGITKFLKLSNGTLNLDFGEINLFMSAICSA